MGLDQYLYLRKHISQSETDERWQSVVGLALDGLTLISDLGVSISYPIGYWNKANAIHGWFVENVQGGRDDCGTYFFGIDALISLRDACQQVLAAPDRQSMEEIGQEVLPPLRGYYFGDYEIDEFYVEYLTKTIHIIDEAVTAMGDDCGWSIDFAYSSSW
jgi:hypothetical protein